MKPDDAPQPSGVSRLLEELPHDLSEETFEPLLEEPAFRLERIVSLGHTSAPGSWYDQERSEWVVVLEGAAVLGFEDGSRRRLERGDAILLPEHCRHRVEWTDPGQPTVWLALHYDGAAGG